MKRRSPSAQRPRPSLSSRARRGLLPSLAVCAALLAAPYRASAQVALPLATGGTANSAYAINDSGYISGSAHFSVGSRAALWLTETSSPINLGSIPSGRYSFDTAVGYGVNASANVTGYLRNSHLASANAFAPFLYTYSTGTLANLGTLPMPGGQSLSYGLGINDTGTVVGYSHDLIASAAWFKTASGSLTALPSIVPPASPGAPGSDSQAVAISNKGDGNEFIVGYSPAAPDGNEGYHATLWKKNAGVYQAVDLGVRPGHAYSYAYAISSNGNYAAGVSYDTSGLVSAVYWQRNTTTGVWSSPNLLKAGTVNPDGTKTSYFAQAINNSGVSGGYSITTNSSGTLYIKGAVTWRNGVMTAFNPSPLPPNYTWNFLEVRAINNSDAIVGEAQHRVGLNYQTRGFKWVAP